MKEENTIRNYLSAMELGRTQKYKNMSVVPLINKGKKSRLEYKLLNEAIEDSSLTIKELDAYGSVNNLTAIVNSEEDVLILKGEYIVGGKQNRMITVNGLIDRDEGRIDIPVHCVEHGRWGYGGYGKGADYEFKSQKIMSAAVRGGVMKRFAGQHGQSATWNMVEKSLGDAGVHSHTQDFGKIYKDKKRDIDDYVHAFDYVSGQVGFVAAISDRRGNISVYMDLFDQAKTLSKHGDRLLASYAVDAITARGDTIKFSKAKAEDFLDEVAESRMTVDDSISLGSDIEITAHNRKRKERINGSGLVYKNTVVYINANKRSSWPDNVIRLPGNPWDTLPPDAIRWPRRPRRVLRDQTIEPYIPTPPEFFEGTADSGRRGGFIPPHMKETIRKDKKKIHEAEEQKKKAKEKTSENSEKGNQKQ
jgi:hypothetical protein